MQADSKQSASALPGIARAALVEERAAYLSIGYREHGANIVQLARLRVRVCRECARDRGARDRGTCAGGRGHGGK